MAKPLTFELKGMDSLLRKMRSGELYVEPWRQCLRLATALVEQTAHRRAAKGRTGALDANLKGRISTAPIPQWGVVSTDATSRKGFRYPFALEAGKRRPAGLGRAQIGRRAARFIKPTVALHYRSGPFAGQSTRKWLRKSLTSNRKRIDGLLNRAARYIEYIWSRNG